VDQLLCMRTFLRVADLHSFTRAADALGVSRAVVSTHVADLEQYLGVQLLHRTTRRVGLTADGVGYLDHCRRILADLEGADASVRQSRVRPQGRLRIDVPSNFGKYLLIPSLPQFTARYPELQLEVQFNERVVDLIEEEIDVVVRVGRVRSPNLIARRVVNTRVITCASPEYLRQYGCPQDPRDLAHHKLIGYLGIASRRLHKWRFQKGSARRQLAFPSSVAFNSADARILAAVRGAGIVQSMDLLVAKTLASGELEVVLKEWIAEGDPISIVYPAALRDSPKVRVFAEFATQLLIDYRRYADRLLAVG
jgi:LysR family transcriptional regulator for bpeEF and oprC